MKGTQHPKNGSELLERATRKGWGLSHRLTWDIKEEAVLWCDILLDCNVRLRGVGNWGVGNVQTAILTPTRLYFH